VINGQMLPRHRNCFTCKEDNQLRNLMKQFGSNSWREISAAMPGRTVRQCRDRWFHYLSKPKSEIPWTADEDATLLEKIGEFGLKWTRLATFFSNRNDLDVKQRWLWICRKQRNLLLKDAARPPRPTRRSLNSTESSDANEIVDDKQESVFPELEKLEMSDYVWTREGEEQDNSHISWTSLRDDFVNEWMDFSQNSDKCRS
jgi:hypothetical protein